MTFKQALLPLFLVFATGSGLLAQTPTPLAPIGVGNVMTLQGGPETMDPTTLKFAFPISVRHKAGAGGLDFDASITFNADPTTLSPEGINAGAAFTNLSNVWTLGLTSGNAQPTLVASETINFCGYNSQDTPEYEYTYTNPIMQDKVGVLREWLYVFADALECSQDRMYFTTSNGTGYQYAYADDGSGVGLYGWDYSESPAFQVYYPDGSSQTVAMAGFAQELAQENNSPYPPASVVLAQDTNGNQITTNTANTAVIDTLGQTVLTGMTMLNGSVQTWGTLSYQNSAGTTYNTTPAYVNYTLSNLNCPGATETQRQGSLLDHVTLPDGRKYSFTYEIGFTSAVTGRLSKVTLPSGGSISYSYGGGFGCASTAGSLARVVNDNNGNSGTWTYTLGTNSSGQKTMTTVDPAGTQTVITYDGAAIPQSSNYPYTGGPEPYTGGRYIEAGRQTFNSVGTLLSTTATSYVGSQASSSNVMLPLQSATVTTSLPSSSGVQSQTYTAYNVLGQVTEVDTYDFGTVGGPVGPLLSKVVTAYPQAFNHTYAPNVTNPATYPGSMTTYDGSGNVIHKSIPTYGSTGLLTQLQRWVSGSTYLTTDYQYDVHGNPYSVTDPNGAVSYTSYTQCNDAYLGSTSSAVKNAAGTQTATLTTSETWDCVAGAPTSSKDVNGNSSGAAYNDPYFRMTSSQDWLGNTTTYTYPTATSNTAETVLNFNSGASTQDSLVTYDGLGRPILNQTRQSPTATTLDTVSTTYDSYGRLYTTSLPYSAAASVVNTSIAKSITTYDPFSRPLLVTNAAGGTTQYTYPANTNDVQIVLGPAPSGENSKKRQLEYNALQQLTSVCEITSGAQSGACSQNTAATGYFTKYTYDGDMQTKVNQNIQSGATLSETRTMSYDGLGRKLSETIPETGTSTFVYDSDSTSVCSGSFPRDQIKSTDALGNVTCASYDNQHRMLTATVVSGTYASVTPQLNFVYDAASLAGNTMQNVAGALAEAYTCTGSCSTKITDIGISTAAELSNGTRTGRVSSGIYESTPHSNGYSYSLATAYPNGILGSLYGTGSSYTMPTLNFGVDGEGRPYTATDATHSLNLVTSTVYNVAAEPTSVSIGNGDTDTLAYDSFYRSTGFKFAVTGSSPFTITGAFTLNTNSSIKSMAITDTNDSTKNQTCNYSADDLSRISVANCGTVWPQTFAYDPFGNITKTSTGAAMSYGAQYAGSLGVGNNRVTGGTTATYDASGNQTLSTAGSFAWNAAAQMVAATTGGTTSQATYDALGRMVETISGSTTTQFVYSRLGTQYAVVQNGTLLRGLVALPGGDTAVYNSSGLNYIRRMDLLGSSRLATTWTHGIYSKDAYAPFGEPYDETATKDRSFTGQDSDLTQNVGVYDFQFRKLDTTAGRWLSPDPYGWNAVDQTNPQTLNRYSYVANNPLKNVDPLGLTFYYVTDCYAASSDGQPVPEQDYCTSYWEEDDDDSEPQATNYLSFQAVPTSLPVPQATNNGNNPPACQATLLNMANQQLGTNFNSSNVAGSYMNGTAYNIIIQSNQLTPGQFNNIQQGRYTTSGWQYLTGAGLAGHIADETNLGFAQSAFQSSNIGGNLSVSFAFHDDHGYANNPIGALIHWITDVLGHNTRKPC